MLDQWMGITVSSKELTVVVLGFDDGGERPRILADETWKLQDGDRPTAYRVLQERLRHHLEVNRITRVMVKILSQ